jgi:hypothetical protein
MEVKLGLAHKCSKQRVLQNTVLRKVVVTKGEELRGDWKKFLIMEFPGFHCPPYVIRVIK